MDRFFFLPPRVVPCAFLAVPCAFLAVPCVFLFTFFPVGNALAEDVSVGNALAEDVSVGNALAEDVSVENAFTEDVSTGNTLAEDISAGDNLAEDVSVKEITPDPAPGSVPGPASISGSASISDPGSQEISWSDPVRDAKRDALLPFRCPFDKIRHAYHDLEEPNDLLMVMAMEKQILAVCRQTQQALLHIAENEIRLRELFGIVMSPPGSPVLSALSTSPALEPESVLSGSDGQVENRISALDGQVENGISGSESVAVVEPGLVAIHESGFESAGLCRDGNHQGSVRLEGDDCR